MARRFTVVVSALVPLVLALAVVEGAAQGRAGRGPRPPRMGKPPAAAAKSRVTERQKARVRERVALAARIVDRHQAEAREKGLSGEWRQARFESLLPLSLESLRRVDDAPNLDALAAAVAAEAAEPHAIGLPSEDLVYTPITPCRYINTRVAAGKLIGYRGYDLAANGAAYGGSAACAPTTLFGVGDDSIGALALNVTVAEPDAPAGWIAVKPTTASPTTSWVNWAQLGAIVANQGVATMDLTASAEEFWLQASQPTHVIVDIFGAFLPPEATALQSYTEWYSYQCPNGTSCWVDVDCDLGYRLTGGGGGVYDMPAGVTLTWNGPYEAVPDNQTWTVEGINASGVAQTLYALAVCTRTPGR